MPIPSEDYREAMRHFPAGVTIVTIKTEDKTHGLTVSAFASVSPHPPLIMVIIDNRHSANDMLQQPGTVFAVNVLHEAQMELSNRFAWLKDEDRFDEGEWETAVTGAPILKNALAWVDCTIYTTYPAGTHTIYIGEIQATAVPRPDEPPLVYWNRGYRRLELTSPKKTPKGD